MDDLVKKRLFIILFVELDNNYIKSCPNPINASHNRPTKRSFPPSLFVSVQLNEHRFDYRRGAFQPPTTKRDTPTKRYFQPTGIHPAKFSPEKPTARISTSNGGGLESPPSCKTHGFMRRGEPAHR